MVSNGESGAASLLSIGYGDQPWRDFLQRLVRHGARYVIDVRSRPASRQPEFGRDALRLLLEREGIRYVYMGDSLGGQPDDPACYIDGRVDYDRCRARDAFRTGLGRLVDAHRGGHRVATMCSELDPERCHRSKMIGEALLELGVSIVHIERDGTLASQSEVIARLTGGRARSSGKASRREAVTNRGTGVNDTGKRLIFTIGVYGFTAETFFAKLVAAGVDMLCDVRSRRGVRGSEYAFATAR